MARMINALRSSHEVQQRASRTTVGRLRGQASATLHLRRGRPGRYLSRSQLQEGWHERQKSLSQLNAAQRQLNQALSRELRRLRQGEVAGTRAQRGVDCLPVWRAARDRPGPRQAGDLLLV